MTNDQDAPAPQTSPILREMRAVRRDMREIMDRQAREIELHGRMNGRLDELMTRVERSLHEVRSDIVLLENRVLTAITEVRNVVDRVNEPDADILEKA